MSPRILRFERKALHTIHYQSSRRAFSILVFFNFTGEVILALINFYKFCTCTYHRNARDYICGDMGNDHQHHEIYK